MNKSFEYKSIINQGSYKIIHFGDSHIQGDRITGQIRATLQNSLKNGGSGVIFPYSLCGSFGPTGTESKITGEYTYSNFLKNPSNKAIGVCGYELSASKGAKLSLKFNDSFKGKKSDTIEIWIHSSQDTSHLTCDGLKLITRQQVSNKLFLYQFRSNSIIESVVINFQTNCSFWGMTFVHHKGLTYQQNGLVGAQFIHLFQNKSTVLEQLKVMNPDMIIFSYGTNESYSKFDSSSYFSKIKSFVQEVQNILPKSVILISNAPDTRSAGKTPDKEFCINNILNAVAQELKISYLDINKAMGGWGSLYPWQKSNLFLPDLLHFNQEGAKLIGNFFSYGLMEAAHFDTTITHELKDQLTTKMNAVLSYSIPTHQTEIVVVENNTDTPPKKPLKKPTKPKSRKKVYIVKKGDTLSHIALKTGKTVKELVRINHLKSPDKLKTGQKIYY